MRRAPLYLAGAAAATTVVSIAASQILLGLALIALLTERDKWRWPPVTWPVVLWVAWTLVSLAASGHAQGGLPQVKKFYVWLMLFVVYSALRTLPQIRAVTLAWAAGATLSTLWGFAQLVHMYRSTPRFFYYVYVNGSRITGFVDHWMTFSALLMMALLMAGAMLLYSAGRRPSRWLMAALTIVAAGILLAFTRSMWLGTIAGALWLLWWKNKWLVAAVPLLIGIVLLVNPMKVRDRALSSFGAQVGVLDSRAHRAALRRVGWEMIAAHPIVGVGPEQVGPQFMQYYPADLPHPFPIGWYKEHLHNLYVHYAAERGLPALGILLWLLGRALFDFWITLRRLPAQSEARWVLHGAIAVIIAVMISGWTELTLGHSQVLEMFLAVLACGYIAVAARGSEFS
ncbi:MAG: O-antigen ligase family protein [Acidobacteriia bacterium]|nr:O-antigen ligase family protein [Terriglobia bacterium]